MLHTQKIAVVYYALKERYIHPEGTFDNKGRWYPSDAENCGITRTRRSPSKKYPYSYMTACRTRQHVKDLAEQSSELFESKFKQCESLKIWDKMQAKKLKKAS